MLLFINLLILMLPLGAISVLRLYENELIRRTEAELISQAAFVGAMWHEVLLQLIQSQNTPIDQYGHPVDAKWRDQFSPNMPFRYVPTSLNISTDPILPRPPKALVPKTPPNKLAVSAGTRITAALRRGQHMTLSSIRVVDHRGNVVATTRSELGKNIAHHEEVKRALRGEHMSVLRSRVSDEPSPPLESISRGNRVRVFMAVPIVDHGRVLGAVVLSRTPVDVGKALYTNRAPILIGAGALFIVVVLVSVLTSLTISRPVRALILQAEAVARGELKSTTPLKRPGTHEVAQLSNAITAMASTLAARAEYIETFAKNVSHEFKTPLTSLRGTVELLRDHLDDMTSEERERFLHILDTDTERLDRLVRRLLDLARADVLEPSDTQTTIKTHIDVLVDRYSAAGLNIVVEHDPKATTILMEPEVFESILSNLLDNARQHGGEGVTVTLNTALIQTQNKQESVRIQIHDDGVGISKANLERVFRQFFTTARETGGSGLGLSIIHTLVQAHKGTIALDSKPGEGTTFTLTLKTS